MAETVGSEWEAAIYSRPRLSRWGAILHLVTTLLVAALIVTLYTRNDPDLHQCAAIGDGPSRLACFDAVARATDHQPVK